jgi:hypothetical protein
MAREILLMLRRSWRAASGGVALLAATLGLALGASAPSTETRARSPYAPYEFLIGEWNVAPESGGPPVAAASFRWGPNRSYIWYATSLLANGEEQPHFEGLLVWNGVQRNLDMLLALDLEGGLLTERGVMSVESYGLVVRDMTAFYSEGTRPIGKKVVGPQGSTARFRQTFKRVRPDRILTTVMRESEHGWVATFPGSDHLAMTRRAKG